MGQAKQEAIARGELQEPESENTDRFYGEDFEHEHDIYGLGCILRRIERRKGVDFMRGLLTDLPLPLTCQDDSPLPF